MVNAKKNYLGVTLIASKHELSNLIIVVDYNKIQALSKIKDALPLDNLRKSLKHLIVTVLRLIMGIRFSLCLKVLKKQMIQKNLMLLFYTQSKVRESRNLKMIQFGMLGS